MGLVENFEVVSRIQDFNYLFLFLFFDSRLGRGGFLGCILEWQGHFKYPFKSRARIEETWGGDIY